MAKQVIDILKSKSKRGHTYNLPWMKFSEKVDSKSSEEMICQAGLDWPVSKRQLEYDGKPVQSWGIFNDMTNSFISSVGSAYAPIQNVQMFDWTDSIIGQLKGAHYVSAGCINDGKQLFAIAKVPKTFVIGKEDEHQIYLSFVSSHDGTITNQIKIIDLRLICLNGLVQISKENASLKIKHTGNIEEKFNQAQLLIDKSFQDVNTIAEKLEFLSKKKMTVEGIQTVLNLTLGENWDESKNWRKKQQIEKISQLFNTPEFEEQRGTAYALFNAYTNYTDHQRIMRNPDIEETTIERAQSAYFGTGVRFKSNTLNTILKVAENMPSNKNVNKKSIDILSMVNWN